MTLETVDKALGETSGPWFLGGDAPSLVDLQYVSHVERMVASLLFWKGLKIRGPTLPNLDAWLSAFEERPAYLATKSDYYTHCMDIPPQYGPGYSIPEAAARGNCRSARRTSRSRRCRTAATRRRATKRPTSCLLYTSPSPRDQRGSRMPSSA